VAPSSVPFTPDEPAPHALSQDEIRQVIADFQAATRRALVAGYEVVEVHAAHGYLLHEFFSPLSNHRTDAYGGSFDNRIRLLLEVLDATRAVWPAHLPLLVRVSATDWVEGGVDGVEAVAIARAFRAEVGMTPARYVERLRVEAARASLESTRRTVKEIATEVGFGTLETLHRVFKRALGVPPAEYRRRFAPSTSHSRLAAPGQPTTS